MHMLHAGSGHELQVAPVTAAACVVSEHRDVLKLEQILKLSSPAPEQTYKCVGQMAT